MTVANQQVVQNTTLLETLKSFLVWVLILEVSFLVVGFPLVTIIVAGAALLAVTLQSFMSSAVLVVATGLIVINLLAVCIASGLLVSRGVYPHEVSWLDWLKSDADPLNQPIYASCPLTCDIQH